MTSPIIAFAGPCLPPHPDRRWRSLLSQVEVRPPAQRGDVLQALGRRPSCLVLLDGFYYDTPAVTHKELLYALESGTPVYGAASMGALRAAEMAPFGMVGVGQVFQWFHQGDLDGDDEVAILHAPEEMGFRPLTVALVEVRHALRRLVDADLIDGTKARDLIDAVKALAFLHRTPTRLSDLAEHALGPAGSDALHRALQAESIKGLDAMAALTLAVERHLERPIDDPKVPEVSTFLSFFREWCLRPEYPEETARRPPTYRQAWGVTQALHPQTPTFVDAMRRRFLLSSAALELGETAAPAACATHVEALQRHLHGQPHGVPLPEAELLEEAQLHALARQRWQTTGNWSEALQPLAHKLGLEPKGCIDRLLDLLALQDDLMPQWFSGA